MKKWILGLVLLVGVTAFAEYDQIDERYIEKCTVTHIGRTKGGKQYLNCRSRQSGRIFNFTSINGFMNQLKVGRTYKVWFTGNGYKNLNITDFTSL